MVGTSSVLLLCFAVIVMATTAWHLPQYSIVVSGAIGFVLFVSILWLLTLIEDGWRYATLTKNKPNDKDENGPSAGQAHS